MVRFGIKVRGYKLIRRGTFKVTGGFERWTGGFKRLSDNRRRWRGSINIMSE